MQEFWSALGERGTITFYDRGWYTAAIDQALFELTAQTERPQALKKMAKKTKGKPLVEDGASKARGEFHGDIVASYQRIAHNFEQALVDDGYIVIKLFVHVSKEAQRKRLKRLRENPNTQWRVSDEKFEQVKHYDKAYELYDRLLETSNFAFAPWTLVNGEDKRAANIQVAQALIGGLVELLQLCQRLLADGCQLVLTGSLSQRVKCLVVVAGIDEPARTMSAIVREIEGHVACGGGCIPEVGKLTVIVNIVRTCQPGIGLNIIASTLSSNGQNDQQHQDRGK
jgi:riboflavin synthase